jgi:uncharacterized protein (DUF927 family)
MNAFGAEMFTPLTGAERTRAIGDEGSAKPQKVPIIPVPDDAPVMQYRHRTHGHPSASWPYRGAEGRLVGYACRFDFVKPDGTPDKDVLPVTYCDLGGGKRGWRSKGIPEPRPLYNLPAITAAQPMSDIIDGRPAILVCEGEKAADAAAALLPELTATTPMHGAKSPAKADWSPLSGRRVVIWPDHDESGRAFAEHVARLAHEAGAAELCIVAVPGHFPEKWDLADSLPEGETAETLRVLILNAEPWSPIPKAEVKAEALDAAGTGQRGFLVLREWIRDSAGNSHAPGVYKQVEKEDKETGLRIKSWSWFCSLLEIAAETRDASGQQWGRLLRITDRDGTVHEWAMPMGMLAGDGTGYRERLLLLGLELAPGKFGRDCLHEYITLWRPDAKARCVDRTGWHGRAFVLPDATHGDTGGESVLLQTAGTAPAYDVAGTLDGWRDEVARYAVGNSRLGVALCIPFAGPLLYLLNEESGGLHFAGGSSTGKTTALYCSASIWGLAVHSWRATDNAAEGLARGASDALLCLDEVSQADGRAVDAMAYMLGNGVGKARMRRDASARPIIAWRLLFISTGEMGLAAKMQEAGRRARAGQEVRVVEIPADAGVGHGLFENLHGFASGDGLARHLRLAAERHKGHAARTFLTEIAADPEGTAKAVAAARDAWTTANVPAGADGQVSRVGRRFGLIAAAGELATALGILPWPEGEAERAAARCFAEWLRARGGNGPAELRDGIAQVRAFLEAHGSSRFEPAWIKEDHRPDTGAQMEDTLRRTINRAGFRRDDVADRWEYFVLPEAWRSELCRGFDAKAIADAMAEKGWLRRADDGRLTHKPWVPRFGTPRVYIVTADFLSPAEGAGAAAGERP